MLEFVRGKVSDRKLLLFAVACCRRVWRLLDPEVCRPGVQVIEHYADGQADEAQLNDVREQARRYGEEWYRRNRSMPRSLESELAYRKSQQGYLVAHAAESAAGDFGMVLIYTTQCAGRDLAGN